MASETGAGSEYEASPTVGGLRPQQTKGSDPAGPSITSADLDGPAGLHDPAGESASPSGISGDLEHTARRSRRTPRTGPWRWLLVAAVVLVPWSWFLVRNLGGRVDFVAVTLPLLGGALVVTASAVALLRRWSLALAFALSTALCTAAAVMLPWRPIDGAAPSRPLQLVQANLAAARGTEAETMISDTLAEQAPDVLVVEELNHELVPFLQGRFPYSAVTDLVWMDVDGTVSGTPLNRAFLGVFSMHPLSDLGDPTELPQGLPGLHLRVEGPGGPFVLYALHLPKPSPLPSDFSSTYRGRATVVDEILRTVRSESLPAVVAGDLNLSDREQGYRELTSVLDDAMRTGSWVGPTSAKESVLWRMLLLRIDHVLRSPSWCSADGHRFDLPFSDHRGAAVKVGPCP